MDDFLDLEAESPGGLVGGFGPPGGDGARGCCDDDDDEEEG